ncbi:uncharacterized protein [Euwallacea fornicatus]|uniref:uncharacterized protein n=1 Tax=Euwallacea fornicatus TaxID=995702 RepID=UPI00338EC467
MYGLLYFGVFVGLVQGGFFDLTDVEDPFALLWNFQPIRDKLTHCSIGDVSGICMEKAKCLIAGGTITKKSCGPFFTCCSLPTKCGATSDKKQAYFSSGSLNPTTTTCQYTIKLRNKNVCQVRLDFEELILAPTISFHSSTLNKNVLTCVNDSLHINPKPYGLPVVCGNSTKQHLFVHVNQTSDSISAVTIEINLANRLDPSSDKLPSPKWKIKFTQLECPLKRHKFDIFKYGDVENINNDFYALAPHGAVQYFTEQTGEFWSFALSNADSDNTLTGYPFGAHYTIAFRRPSSKSCIKFIPSEIKLLPSSVGVSPHNCGDYLHVPEYYTDSDLSTTTEPMSEVCETTSSFYSLVPGPFFVNFKSMETLTDVPMNGNFYFAITYQIFNSGCPDNVS